MDIIGNKFSLGFFPTPLQYLTRLSGFYPGYQIYIKRDDQTGLASGGNKTRKLEYLIKLALDENCDTVITAGAQQSNHCRQTAAACAVAGLECHLLLGGSKPEKYDGNLLLSKLLGAHIHFAGENRKGEDIPLLKSELERGGKKCSIIPYGGSTITGALGFVSAVKELKDQLLERSLKMDYIFFASSSGGMQSGLMLGLDLYDLDARLMPVNIDKDETLGHSLEEVILGILTEGKTLLRIGRNYVLEDIPLIKDYDKSGYGVITENEVFAMSKLARNEGILLDPVYTGRAFYGMLDILRKQNIPLNSNVLFWHTGGLPSNFYYGDQILKGL